MARAWPKLASSSDEITTLLDGAGRIRWQSASLGRVLGHRQDAFVGRSFTDLAHPEDRELVELVLGECLEVERPDGGVLRAPCRLLDADGNWRDTRSTVTDLRHLRGVGGMVVHTLDTTEQQTVERQLARMSFTDLLTGVGNRAMLFDRLERALAMESALTVVVLDLDDFRSVNDMHGQDVGDALLIEVSNRLSAALPVDATLARSDADVFSIVLSGHVAGARQFVDGLMQDLSAPFSFPQGMFEVTASAGIAFADPLEDAATVLRKADLALRRAHGAGRGRIEVYQPHLHEEAMAAISLENDLRDSFDLDHFAVVFQPIVSLQDRRIVGVEALLRWHHPTRGTVGPEEFVPVAERSGLILALGRWVLDEACREGARWRAAGHDIYVSVNVSVRQVQSRRLIADVEEALASTGFPASSLTLEITENSLLDETDRTIADLEVLHRMGAKIALDDFGKGYSSLSYLRRLPVDVLKIDREFVSGVPIDPVQTALTESVVALARRLGLRVIVEGIEDEVQYLGLCAMGAEMGQGFWFARGTQPANIDGMLGETLGQKPPVAATGSLPRILG